MNDPCPTNQSRLVDLISGLLSRREADEILEHVRSCGACEAELRALAAQHDYLRAGPLPTMSGGTIDWARARRGRPALRWVAVAAGIAAIVAGMIWLQHPDPLEYWIPVAHEETVLRTADRSRTPSIEGVLEPYRRHDAEAAIEALQNLVIPPEEIMATRLRLLYLASAFANAGRHDEALAALRALDIASLPVQWRRQARWVEYFSLVRTGRTDEARTVLLELVDEPGEIGERARAEERRARAP